MKISILYINIIILAVLSFLSSCNDDFLDRSSKDKVEAPFFFNTAKDLEVASNALYAMLPDFNIYTEDAGSDNLVPLNPSTKIRGSRIVLVGGGSGGWSWGNLRMVNYFLCNYIKADYQAEAAKISAIDRMLSFY